MRTSLFVLFLTASVYAAPQNPAVSQAQGALEAASLRWKAQALEETRLAALAAKHTVSIVRLKQAERDQVLAECTYLEAKAKLAEVQSGKADSDELADIAIKRAKAQLDYSAFTLKGTRDLIAAKALDPAVEIEEERRYEARLTEWKTAQLLKR